MPQFLTTYGGHVSPAGLVVANIEASRANPTISISTTLLETLVVLVVGITTFKRGYIWRVGNEDKINILNDP
jgi:hypothetical protein